MSTASMPSMRVRKDIPRSRITPAPSGGINASLSRWIISLILRLELHRVQTLVEAAALDQIFMRADFHFKT